MALLGSTTKPSYTTRYQGYSYDNKYMLRLTLPSGGPWRVTTLGAWLAGDSSHYIHNPTVYLMAWNNASGALLGNSAGFTPTARSYPASDKYEYAVTSPFTVAGGTTIMVGFGWTPWSGGYGVQWATDNANALAGPNHTVPGDSGVVYTDSGKLGAWLYYEQANSPPTAPTLDSPVGGAWVAGNNPTLYATPHDPDGDTMTQYRYQVAWDSGFSSVIEDQTVGGSFPNNVQMSRQIQTWLPNGNTFYWRMVFADAISGWGAWSGGQSFYVRNLPNAPSLDSPGNWTGVSSQSPTLYFTPSGTDGQDCQAYQYQVDSDGNFGSPDDDYQVNGTYPMGTQVSRAVVATLSRGTWYYWRVRFYNSAVGWGPWSSAYAFLPYSIPTCAVTVPASAVMATLYYAAGSNTTPKLKVSWNFADGDGHAQSSAQIKVYLDSGGSPGALQHTHNHSGADTTAYLSGFAPTNGTKYHISVTVTCAAGMTSSESAKNICRVRWARASYYFNMGSVPVGWAAPVVNATGNYSVVEWAASTTTAEPSTWYAQLSDVPIGSNTYVWHRVTMWDQSNTASPTKPTVQDVTPKWNANNLIADYWQYGAGVTIDPSDQKYGTQSLKIAGTTGQWIAAYQVVPVQANTDYLLSGYIKSTGDSEAYVRVLEADGSAVIVSSPVVAATQDFARVVAPAFNSGSRTSVRVVCTVNGATDTYARFDALKLEASSVVTPWTPGFVGEGVTVDSGGLQVDAQAGGVFRLRGATGGGRDIVTLGNNGLKFGGDTELYSPGAGVIETPTFFRAKSHISTGRYLHGLGDSGGKWAKLAHGGLTYQYYDQHVTGRVFSRYGNARLDFGLDSDAGVNAQPSYLWLKKKELGGKNEITFKAVVESVGSSIDWSLWASMTENWVDLYWVPEMVIFGVGYVGIDDPGAVGWQASLPAGTQYAETAW